MAASTLLGAGPVHGTGEHTAGFSAAACVRLATTVPGLQLLSTNPGCVMASPTAPWSDLSSTWLLLRISVSGPRTHKLPRVPEQQVMVLPLTTESVALPPVVPSLTGGACARCSSLGKGVPVGVGVGVGGGGLECPPPQPARPSSSAEAQIAFSIPIL